MMRRVFSNDKKEVYVDDKTGIEKIIHTNDPEHLEAVKSRDWIQPYGPDEKEFFAKYKHLKKTSKGKIVDKNEERQRETTRAFEIEEYEKKQRARMKQGNEKYKKYY